MNKKNKLDGLDLLAEAFLSLETEEECKNFLLDLCTITEIQSMSQRFEVAKQLRAQQIYADIVASTGASTATISRVNRALNYGENGYQVVLDRMDENGKL